MPRSNYKTGFECCAHTCVAGSCKSRTRTILWRKEGNSCPRHSRNPALHPDCSTVYPAHNNAIDTREPTNDELALLAPRPQPPVLIPQLPVTATPQHMAVQLPPQPAGINLPAPPQNPPMLADIVAAKSYQAQVDVAVGQPLQVPLIHLSNLTNLCSIPGT
jgi:hypothetical protein